MKQEQRGDVATMERTRGGVSFLPPVDIVETDDELLLFADMPGVAAEDLDVRFEDGELTIFGRVSPRHENIDFTHGEYGIGDFFRTFLVDEAIDATKISAELNHGVLTLHLPKSEEVKPKRISIKAV
jgi:HSP20 family protein